MAGCDKAAKLRSYKRHSNIPFPLFGASMMDSRFTGGGRHNIHVHGAASPNDVVLLPNSWYVQHSLLLPPHVPHVPGQCTQPPLCCEFNGTVAKVTCVELRPACLCSMQILTHNIVLLHLAIFQTPSVQNTRVKCVPCVHTISCQCLRAPTHTHAHTRART